MTRGYAILLYHSIGETSWKYEVKLSDFQSHLNYLKANCPVLPIPLIAERLKRRKCDGFYCGITFDDGYRNNHEAFHALRKHDFPATIFVATKYIGGRFGKREMLAWNEIKELHLSGLVDFGSHTHTHRDLTSLSAKEVREELSISKTILNEKLDCSIRFVSVPGGQRNKSVKEAAKEVGLAAMFSSEPIINVPKQDNFEIGRICIFNSASDLSSFIFRLYCLRQKLQKFQIT